MKTESIRYWPLVLALICLAAPAFAYTGIHGGGHGKPAVNYDSLFEAAAPLEESADGREIIERCMATYGGREHLAQLHSIRLQYYMVSSISGDTSEFDRLMTTGRRLKTSRHGIGTQKERYLDGNLSWRVVDTVQENLEGAAYCASLFTSLTLNMPLAMETEPFSDIRVGRRAGDSLDYIYLKKNDSLMIVIGLESDGSKLRSSEGIIYGGEKAEIYINLFDDQRHVDGYLWPHRVTLISQGFGIGYLVLEELEINPAVSDSEFRPGGSPKSDY